MEEPRGARAQGRGKRGWANGQPVLSKAPGASEAWGSAASRRGGAAPRSGRRPRLEWTAPAAAPGASTLGRLGLVCVESQPESKRATAPSCGRPPPFLARHLPLSACPPTRSAGRLPSRRGRVAPAANGELPPGRNRSTPSLRFGPPLLRAAPGARLREPRGRRAAGPRSAFGASQEVAEALARPQQTGGTRESGHKTGAPSSVVWTQLRPLSEPLTVVGSQAPGRSTMQPLRGRRVRGTPVTDCADWGAWNTPRRRGDACVLRVHGRSLVCVLSAHGQRVQRVQRMTQRNAPAPPLPPEPGAGTRASVHSAVRTRPAFPAPELDVAGAAPPVCVEGCGLVSP